MHSIHVIMILIVLCSIIPVVMLIILIKKQKQKQHEAVGDIFKSPSIFKMTTRGTDTFNDVHYSYEFFRGARNAPPHFKVALECPSQFSFKLAKQTACDRFFARLGICRKIRTGDMGFDDTFFITTDHTNFAEIFFNSVDKRTAIMNMYEKGFNQFEFNGKEMMAKIFPFRLSSKITKAFIQEIVPDLITLTKMMPTISRTDESRLSGWKIVRAVSFAIPISFIVSGLIALFFSLENYNPFDGWLLFIDSLKMSIPVFLIYVWIVMKSIKGRTSSHKEFIVIAAISLIACFIAGFGLKMFLNGYLDRAAVSLHEAPIIHKIESRSKSTTYYAVVRSWRNNRETEKLRISRSDFHRIEPNNSTLLIRTKSGKFGFEWLVNYDIQ